MANLGRHLRCLARRLLRLHLLLGCRLHPLHALISLFRWRTDRLNLLLPGRCQRLDGLLRGCPHARGEHDGQATEQKAPSGFNATVGAIVPSTLKTEPVPSKAATSVPALKSFNFAMVDGKLLIVNPSDKKIVDVISG